MLGIALSYCKHLTCKGWYISKCVCKAFQREERGGGGLHWLHRRLRSEYWREQNINFGTSFFLSLTSIVKTLSEDQWSRIVPGNRDQFPFLGLAPFFVQAKDLKSHSLLPNRKRLLRRLTGRWRVILYEFEPNAAWMIIYHSWSWYLAAISRTST